MKNTFGLGGLMLLVLGFLVPILHKPMTYLGTLAIALACSIVAATGTRRWFWLAGVAAVLTMQALVALAIEG
jgi:hypothetical protein